MSRRWGWIWSASLIVHAEDEFDPIGRVGLISLKALARVAGLGWQGRPLLTVSPEYGPLHRLIAVLTDMPLRADQPLAKRCGNCSLYVDKCPRHALTLVPFEDHLARREDILDIELCLGDDGGQGVRLVVCPWAMPSGTLDIRACPAASSGRPSGPGEAGAE